MNREIFRPDDVYVRPLRRDEKAGGRFKGKKYVCCSNTGEPIEVYATILEALWDSEKHGAVPHTVH